MYMVATRSLRNAGEFEEIFIVVLIAKFVPDLRQFVSRLHIWLSEAAVVKFRWESGSFQQNLVQG